MRASLIVTALAVAVLTAPDGYVSQFRVVGTTPLQVDGGRTAFADTRQITGSPGDSAGADLPRFAAARR